MSSISIAGDTSGSILLQAPAVAGSGTLTLPTGTATLGIQGPAFSAWLGSNQTISTSTFTKIQYNTEEFDTNSNYDTTNYRFTPTVAGYYQINGSVNISSSSNIEVLCVVYKNGVEAKWGIYLTRGSTVLDASSVVSALIYLNGSTDYIELFGYINGTGTLRFTGSQSRSYFQASMVRSA